MAREGEAAAAVSVKEKASDPTDLSRNTWRYIVRRTTREFGADDLPDAAASLTYYGVLSIFPALIAVIGGAVVFGDAKDTIAQAAKIVRDAFPGTETGGAEDALGQIAEHSGWLPFLLGTALTIWTVSRYVGGFSRTMNRIYGIAEGRSFWVLKPQQLLVALAFIVLVGIITTLLIVSGPIADAVGKAANVGEPWLTIWAFAKWPVLVVLAIVLIGMLYWATPNAHQHRFRWLSMGALIALVALVVSSALFYVYIANFSNYDRIYGSLAGALIFLIWLWIANLAMLFGAEYDSEVERGRQLESGIAAEEELVMRPRDTALSERRAVRLAKLVDDGRAIRYSSAPRAPRPDGD